jgi:hypothetical protein
MNTGAGAVGVASIERILGRDRLAYLRVEVHQVVQRREIGPSLLEVPHPDQVQQYPFEGRVASAFALAQRRPVDDGASSADCGQAVRHDQPRIVVRMELQVLGGQP